MQSDGQMQCKRSIEESDFNVPVDFSSDPRSTAGSGDLYSDNVAGGSTDISKWPSNLGLAATFSEEHMYNFAKASSEEYRALGIATALGPQMDLATEPRWLRNGGTFGENSKIISNNGTSLCRWITIDLCEWQRCWLGKRFN